MHAFLARDRSSTVEMTIIGTREVCPNVRLKVSSIWLSGSWRSSRRASNGVAASIASPSLRQAARATTMRMSSARRRCREIMVACSSLSSTRSTLSWFVPLCIAVLSKLRRSISSAPGEAHISDHPMKTVPSRGSPGSRSHEVHKPAVDCPPHLTGVNTTRDDPRPQQKAGILR